MIEAPAREAGLATDAGLADLMIRDIAGEPGSLPLLSHALYETWLRREHRTLTVAGYHACGGVRGAIAQTADTVVAGLGADGEQLAAEVFVRLTELGEGSEDTRRRVHGPSSPHSDRRLVRYSSSSLPPASSPPTTPASKSRTKR